MKIYETLFYDFPYKNLYMCQDYAFVSDNAKTTSLLKDNVGFAYTRNMFFFPRFTYFAVHQSLNKSSLSFVVHILSQRVEPRNKGREQHVNNFARLLLGK